MTGSERLPDTNVILRYLLQDDEPLYNRAKALFEKVRVGEERVIILESVLVECVYVLLKFYRVPREDILSRLRELLCYKGVINRDKDDLVEALILFAEEKLDIVDCLLCAKARTHNSSLITFDKDLERCARKDRA